MRNRIVAASAPYTTAQQRPPPARVFGSALLGVVCFPKTGPCVMRVSGAPCRAKRRGRDSLTGCLPAIPDYGNSLNRMRLQHNVKKMSGTDSQGTVLPNATKPPQGSPRFPPKRAHCPIRFLGEPDTRI